MKFLVLVFFIILVGAGSGHGYPLEELLLRSGTSSRLPEDVSDISAIAQADNSEDLRVSPYKPWGGCGHKGYCRLFLES